MANISVVGRIVSDDIELKVSANNRPYLRFDLAERTGKGAYARTQYYQVVAFGAIASQFAKRELHRGALINVEGVLRPLKAARSMPQPCWEKMASIRSWTHWLRYRSREINKWSYRAYFGIHKLPGAGLRDTRSPAPDL